MYIRAYLTIFISSNLDKQPLLPAGETIECRFCHFCVSLPFHRWSLGITNKTLIWSIHHTRGLTTQTFQSVEMLLFLLLEQSDCEERLQSLAPRWRAGVQTAGAVRRHGQIHKQTQGGRKWRETSRPDKTRWFADGRAVSASGLHFKRSFHHAKLKTDEWAKEVEKP